MYMSFAGLGEAYYKMVGNDPAEGRSGTPRTLSATDREELDNMTPLAMQWEIEETGVPQSPTASPVGSCCPAPSVRDAQGPQGPVSPFRGVIAHHLVVGPAQTSK